MLRFTADSGISEVSMQNSILNEPVAESKRIRSIDTLRGFALLGILLLNIIPFSGPMAAYFDPSAGIEVSGLNLAVAMFVDIWGEGAFRAIFSMLFGAGLLIFLAKPGAEEEGRLRSLYYRRTWLLVAFGLFNAYVLLWFGDILYTYGVTGLVLYFFRNLSANKLALCSTILFLFLALIHTSQYFYTKSLYTDYREVVSLPEGNELSEAQKQSLENWDEYLQNARATPEQIAFEANARSEGYIENFIFTAPINMMFQTALFLINGFWDAAAMMLLGMALMKWNVFDASRELSLYSKMMVLGFAIGLVINSWEEVVFVSSGFEPFLSATARPTYDLGRLAMALGYVGMIMLLCKLDVISKVRHALACVGQMALTNYLAQSVICNTIFLGFGFGMWGKMQRYEIYFVVIGIWIFQLLFSVAWLKKYRFGPAEWLWRSLTYRKRQPLRKIANQV
tara:strand:+ start:560 stop:1912 length:1353 start_codon:yes stop_codon:yes gene_type:complete